jgi:hypothetical protein
MLQKLPQRDPLASYKRGVIAQRTIGARQCPCGEARPEALIADRDPVICAGCKRKSEGLPINDDHHVAGSANDPTTLPIPVNDHRAELSVAQRDWPKETLENRDGSPLLTDAARIRGFVDTLIYLIETLLLGRAERLETLNTYLVKKLGPKWWADTELEQVGQKR